MAHTEEENDLYDPTTTGPMKRHANGVGDAPVGIQDARVAALADAIKRILPHVVPEIPAVTEGLPSAALPQETAAPVAVAVAEPVSAPPVVEAPVHASTVRPTTNVEVVDAAEQAYLNDIYDAEMA